jgi:hypothetical protein
VVLQLPNEPVCCQGNSIGATVAQATARAEHRKCRSGINQLVPDIRSTIFFDGMGSANTGPDAPS